MRYILLMAGTQADWQALGALPPENVTAHVAFMKELRRQLKESGELVSDQGLSGPDQARVVRARGGGAPVISKPPFPAAREFVAAYWVLDCDIPQRAIEIAARVSAAPGGGGVPLNAPVEVRQVMRAPGEEM